jgi:hypothetical protein
MPFRKTFNKSESAAVLALAELYKQGLIEDDVFEFRVIECGPVTTQTKGDIAWFSRRITFKLASGVGIITVSVKTQPGPIGKRQPSEVSFWDAEIADVYWRGVGHEYRRTRYPDHIYWSQGSY